MIRPYFRHLLAAAGAMALVCAAAACSSGTTTTTATATASGSAAGSGTSACAANAQKQVTTNEQPVTLPIAQLPKPVSSLALGGKSVAFIGDTSAGVIADAYDGYAAAGKLVGLNVKLFSVGFTIPAVDAAFESAISEHVSAIAVSATSLPSLTTALQKAAAAHIPVISQFETFTDGSSALGSDPVASVKGFTTITTWLDGVKTAEYAMAKTNCNLTFAFLDSSSLLGQAQIGNYVQALFNSDCPKTCHYVEIQMTPNDVSSTQVIPLVTTAVERNPGIQYIYADNGAEGAWALQGLKAAGKLGKIGVLSEGGTSNVVQQLSDPSSGYTGAIDPPTYYIQGWALMDTTLEVFEGVNPAIINLPQRLVITGSAAASNPLQSESNYESRYATAWGVSS